jgi:hypothetical protein
MREWVKYQVSSFKFDKDNDSNYNYNKLIKI